MIANLFIGTELGLFRLEKTSHDEWLAAENIFSGKRIMDVAISSSEIFAAVAGEGVFRSADDGESWRMIFGGSPTVVAWGAQNVWVGTANCELYRSPDAGETWHNLTESLHAANQDAEWYPPPFADDPMIATIAISPMTRHIMVGIQNGGTVLSTDGGMHWVLTADVPDEAVYRLRAHPFLPGQWLANTESGIFFSRDDGYQWEEMMAGIDLFYTTDAIISADGRCFAAASGTPPGNWVENSRSTLFMAEQPGDTWQPVSLSRAEYITAFAPPTDLPNVIFGTQSGAVYLEKAGVTREIVGQVGGAVTALCGKIA